MLSKNSRICRPGDLVFSSWPHGLPAALDFAVTSPFALAVPADAASTPLAAANLYEVHKLTDRDTAARCAQHNLQLIPMVIESTGGWGPLAQDALKTIARSGAKRSGLSVAVESQQLYETLGVILQRFNARAVLCRMT